LFCLCISYFYSLKCESVEDPYGAATEAKDFVGNTTGLVYDVFMTEHYNPWDSEHVEKPLRMTQAFARCEELNLVERCERIPTRFATDEVNQLDCSFRPTQFTKTSFD